LFLLYSWTFRGHTNGDKWILAESKKDDDGLESHILILRKNGNFTVNSNYIDFGSSTSGSYKKNGDTIILDRSAVDRAAEEITTVYLIKSGELIPLFDTTNKWTFKVTQTK